MFLERGSVSGQLTVSGSLSGLLLEPDGALEPLQSLQKNMGHKRICTIFLGNGIAGFGGFKLMGNEHHNGRPFSGGSF